jgi:hypothetical protein
MRRHRHRKTGVDLAETAGVKKGGGGSGQKTEYRCMMHVQCILILYAPNNDTVCENIERGNSKYISMLERETI